jgi:hypothetical protein
MNFLLAIETHDRSLAFAMAGYAALKTGTVVATPGGVGLEFRGTTASHSRSLAEVCEFIVHTSMTVDTCVFAAWLYEKFRDKPLEKLTMNRRVLTEITSDGVRRLVEEVIKGRR